MSRLAYPNFHIFINSLFMGNPKDTLFIFVEDDDLLGIYQRLFNHIFQERNIEIIPGVKIATCVDSIETGGKDTLNFICCNLRIDTHVKRFEFDYRVLFDADFELLYDNFPPKKEAQIIYLQKYCFENYVIDSDVVVLAMQKYYSDKSPKKILDLIKFQNWVNLVIKDFALLFANFAFNYGYSKDNHKGLVRKSDMSMRDIGLFFSKDKYHIDPLKIKQYSEILHSRLNAKNPPMKVLGLNLEDFLTRYTTCFEKEPMKLISGKFLLYSLFGFLKKVVKVPNLVNNLDLFRNELFISMIDNRASTNFPFIK